MTPTEIATVLRQFNEWQKGDGPLDYAPIGLINAVDAAIEMIERLEAAEKVHDALHNALSRHHAREMGEGRDHYHSLTKLTVSAYQQSGLCADTIAALEATPSTRLPEKLCYDSRWEIPIDYVDGWNAAVDMMRGKSPSWHCPDCCIAFPFGAPKACPHDDSRCNKLLADAKESA